MVARDDPLRREGLLRRARPFIAATVVGLLAALLPEPILFGPFIGGLGVLLLALLAVALIPWERLPRSLQILPLLLYTAGVPLLLVGEGGVGTGLLPLLLVPTVWSSLYGRRRETVAVLACGLLAIFAAGLLSGHLDTLTMARRVVIWAAIGGLAGFTIHSVRSMLMSSIAEREEMIRRAAALDIIAGELHSTLDPDSVVTVAVKAAARLSAPVGDSAVCGQYYRVGEGEAYLAVEYRNGVRSPSRELALPLRPDGALARLMRGREPLVLRVDEHTAQHDAAAAALAAEGVTAMLAMAVRVGAGDRGLIAITTRTHHVFGERQASSLRSLVSITELALSNALAHAREARTDALTGLSNRREFDERLYTMPRGIPYAVLSVDVDRLKPFNDTHGHLAGDELLRGVAEALRDAVRAGDVLARTGGDEFCAILYGAETEAAREVSERMLANVASLQVRGERARISIGCAPWESGIDPQERLAASDRALYEAKSGGRARFVMAPAAGQGHEAASSSSIA